MWKLHRAAYLSTMLSLLEEVGACKRNMKDDGEEEEGEEEGNVGGGRMRKAVVGGGRGR